MDAASERFQKGEQKLLQRIISFVVSGQDENARQKVSARSRQNSVKLLSDFVSE
jgi:hypothetical protein